MIPTLLQPPIHASNGSPRASTLQPMPAFPPATLGKIGYNLLLWP